jgi:membrane protease YdiL (CAAX protease family)
MDVFAFILIVTVHLWLVLPATGGKSSWDVLFIVGAVSTAAISLWRRGTTRQQMGIKHDGLLKESAIYLGAAGFFAGMVVLCFRGSLEPMGRGFLDLRRIPWHLTWAFLQQFCLLAFLLNRLREILRQKVLAVSAAAGVFAFFHLPNPFLTLVTLGGGLILACLFLRWPNLIAATLAHAAASALVGSLLPPQITGWMRVGPLYWWAGAGR